jgi:hypothetical protein
MKIKNKKNWYQMALEAKKAKPMPQQEYFYDEACLLDEKPSKGLKKIIDEAIEAGKIKEKIFITEIIDIDHEEVTPNN